MKILVSNFSPVTTAHEKYSDKWADLFHSNEKIEIAVGYASNDSLLYLKKLIELNGPKEVNICIGMAKFDGLYASQINASQALDDYLLEQECGRVYVCHQFPFHGKIQTFQKQDIISAGLIGSSNLTNIVPPIGLSRGNYEVDVLIQDQATLQHLNQFMDSLLYEASVLLPDAAKNIEIKSAPNRLLESRFDVVTVESTTKEATWHANTPDTFEIPIKTTEKSNLNAFFGEGRRNSQGYVKPRHWYEVEIIVDVDIQRSAPNYPSNKEFIAYSDDGYKFVLKTSGDYGKNLRSRDDLTLLGRWIKGRLEESGCLLSGHPVTETTLQCYGRQTLTMTRTTKTELDPITGEKLDVWTIDFSPPEAG